MRQALNTVTIEGVLSEVDVNYGSYVKDNKTVECIRGTITVLVNETINGEDSTCEIPVVVFSPKFKKDGGENPAYSSIEKVKNEFTSIAAAGGINGADRVRITGAQIKMNEYFGANGQLISYPRINASFINKIKKDDCKPTAIFTCEMVVAQKNYKVDSDGVEVEPRTLCVKGILPQFGGSVDVIDFVCSNENVASVVDEYWEVNSTVKVQGRLNFSSKVETIKEELDFGEPVERKRTVSTSELVITGGAKTPLEGEYAFSMDDIQSGLAQRKMRLEKSKEKANKPRERKAPAPAGDLTTSAPMDLGF